MSSSTVHYDTGWRFEDLSPTHRNRVLLDWVGKDKEILEMGCSAGFLSKYFALNGCMVTGLESDPIAAERAKEHCRSVLQRDLNSPEWHVGIDLRFEIIVLGDVLEHLLDPVGVLKQCRELLSPNGSIIVSLPNVAHWTIRLELLRGRWDYRDIGILDRTHLKFFTLHTARKLFIEAGYEILRFHPVIGGAGAGRLPQLWTMLTNSMPNLMAYQLLFEISPVE